jgi:hypothetical protein
LMTALPLRREFVCINKPSVNSRKHQESSENAPVTAST